MFLRLTKSLKRPVCSSDHEKKYLSNRISSNTFTKRKPLYLVSASDADRARSRELLSTVICDFHTTWYPDNHWIIRYGLRNITFFVWPLNRFLWWTSPTAYRFNMVQLFKTFTFGVTLVFRSWLVFRMRSPLSLLTNGGR